MRATQGDVPDCAAFRNTFIQKKFASCRAAPRVQYSSFALTEREGRRKARFTAWATAATPGVVMQGYTLPSGRRVLAYTDSRNHASGQNRPEAWTLTTPTTGSKRCRLKKGRHKEVQRMLRQGVEPGVQAVKPNKVVLIPNRCWLVSTFGFPYTVCYMMCITLCSCASFWSFVFFFLSSFSRISQTAVIFLFCFVAVNPMSFLMLSFFSPICTFLSNLPIKFYCIV